MGGFLKKKKIRELAHEVMVLSRNTLMVNLRFLDLALSQFQYISAGRISIATDGSFAYSSIDFIYIPETVKKIGESAIFTLGTEDIVIKGKIGSEAERYAIDHEIAFSAV